jgi:hypothetical protein
MLIPNLALLVNLPGSSEETNGLSFHRCDAGITAPINALAPARDSQLSRDGCVPQFTNWRRTGLAALRLD